MELIVLNRELAIKRSNEFLLAGHSLFDWLLSLGHTSILVFDSKKDELVRIQKKREEIIRLDFDYKVIEKIFFDWRFSDKEWWKLTAGETLMFIDCCRAANYYLIKQGYNIGSSRYRISLLYENLATALLK